MLNHKTIKTILTIIFLVIGFSFAGGTDSIEEKSDIDFSGYTEAELDSLAYYWMGPGADTFNGYSKIEEKLYRVDIHPITPKDGIWTGYVIAYGHYIKPPYKFEIKHDTILYINDVQIEPPIESLIKIRKIAQKWHFKHLEEKSIREGMKPYQEHVSRLAEEIEGLFKALMESRGRDVVIDTIKKLLQSDTLIWKFSVEPLEEDIVTVGIWGKGPGGKKLAGRLMELRLKPYNPYKSAFPKPKDETERISWIKERLESDIKHNEDILRKGGLLVGNSWHSSSREIFLIYEIMSANSLNLAEKVQQLRKIDPTYRFCKEVIYNYSQKEFQELERRR